MMGQPAGAQLSSGAAGGAARQLLVVLVLAQAARCMQPALSAPSGLSKLPDSMANGLDHQEQHSGWAAALGGDVRATATAGQRSLSAASFPTPLPPAEKYLQFLGCQDFSSQLQCLLDGLVLGKLLDVTVVLPRWYSSYDASDLAQAHTPASSARYDTQGRNAVPMSQFWDVDALMAALAGSVKVVKELPLHLQGNPEGARNVRCAAHTACAVLAVATVHVWGLGALPHTARAAAVWWGGLRAGGGAGAEIGPGAHAHRDDACLPSDEPALPVRPPAGTYTVSDVVDPAITPRSLHRLQAALARRQVLRLACVLRKVKYTTTVSAFPPSRVVLTAVCRPPPPVCVCVCVCTRVCTRVCMHTHACQRHCQLRCHAI